MTTSEEKKISDSHGEVDAGQRVDLGTGDSQEPLFGGSVQPSTQEGKLWPDYTFKLCEF